MERICVAATQRELARTVMSSFNSLTRIKNSIGKPANAVLSPQDTVSILIEAKTPPSPQEIEKYESLASPASVLGEYMLVNGISLILEESAPFSNSVKSYWKITLRPKELIK